MPANRHYRVRVRIKVRNRLFRRSGFVLGFALTVGLAAYAGFRSFGAVSGFSPVPVFSFRLKALKLNCAVPAVTEEIRALFSARLGRALSSSDCSALALEIKKRHTAVSEVSVRRNFLNGGAAVTVRLETVLTPVFLEGGTTAYLSESGKLISENFSPPPQNDLRAEIYGPPDGFNMSALAGFISDMGVLEKSFLSPPDRLEYRPREKTCRIFLRNGCEVLWGEFEFTRLKVLRLNEVLNDVSLKLRLPVRVDLRSFREGRIFVSAGA